MALAPQRRTASLCSEPLLPQSSPTLQVDSLLHLHERKKWVSKRGANGNPAEGTGGPKRRRAEQGSAPALKVPVPMGTVIKDKKGNLIAELIQPGNGYCICRGGAGGRGTLIPATKRTDGHTTKRDAKLEVRPHTPCCNAAPQTLQLSRRMPRLALLHPPLDRS